MPARGMLRCWRHMLNEAGAVATSSFASVHAVAIVFVGKSAEELACAVGALQDQRGVAQAVEGVGLDGGVVYHVLEDHFVAHTERTREAPVAHPVATKTAVAA